MTHEEALARCEALNREGAGQERWFPRQAAQDDWELVSVRAPGLRTVRPANTVVESQRRPVDPADPRPRPIFNPYWGAGS